MKRLNNATYLDANRMPGGMSLPKAELYTQMAAYATIPVPADFPGHHLGNYPVGYGTVGNPVLTRNDAAPGSGIAAQPPSFGIGSIRSHDCAYGFWRRNNPTQGTYDWSYLDLAIDDAKAKGWSFWYTLFGTPSWAASTLNAMNTWVDVYGIAGGCAPPAQMSYVTDFITALVTRYNTGANAGANRKIQTLEVWNEPVFRAPTTAGAAKPYFYWGTMAQMLAMVKAVSDAAKAVDPGIKISSPGFAGSGYAMQFLSNIDAGSGLYGHELVDIISFHPYAVFPTPYESGLNMIEGQDDSFANGQSSTGYGSVIDYLTKVAPGKPIVYSENGFDPAPPGAHTSAGVTTHGVHAEWFLAQNTQYRRARVIRTGLITLLQGVKNIYFYSYGSLLCGALLPNVSDGADTPTRYDADTDGAIAGMNYLRSIAGKTITSGGYWSDGSVSATFSDGTSIRI